MSDPTVEEETLISQDDIDKLMDSSSIEEAEKNISSDGADDADELGELSQDDIDRLMNSNVEGEEPLEESEIDDEDMELISQSDIDELMNSAGPDEEQAAAEDVEPEAASSDDDLGELSQDDIDSLMNAAAPADEEDDIPEEALPHTEDDDLGEDFEMISQDDINSLMEQSVEEDEDPVQEEDSVEIPEPDADIDPEPEVEPEMPETVQAAPEDRFDEDYVIEESEAVDVQDALIEQETIDSLIDNFSSEPDPEPVVLDEEPESVPEADEALDIPDDIGLEGEAAGDMDDFLKPSSEMKTLDLDGEGDDVSQEDIDALLMDDEDEEEDDILISQDDIDTLLMAADQEDEDVLGDLMEDEADDLEDDFEDELGEELSEELDEELETDVDILDEDAFDDMLDDDEEDQVVLEEGEEDLPAIRPKKKKAKKEGARWYRSRLVIAGVSALIVLGITIPLSYFLFFSGEPEVPQQTAYQPAPQVMQPDTNEIEIETVDIDLKAQQAALKKSGNIVLEDFVILASDYSKELTYITADISIDYSDQRAYHEINGNLPFYRDLIYDSINKSLVSENKDEITEADILWIVETTLKKVLSGDYIRRVSFKSFQAS